MKEEEREEKGDKGGKETRREGNDVKKYKCKYVPDPFM